MSKRRKNESTGLDRELERYSAMGRTTVSRPSKAGRWLGYGAASAAMVVGSTAEAALIFTGGEEPVTLHLIPNQIRDNTLELDVNSDNDADFELSINHHSIAYPGASSYENGQVFFLGLNGAEVFIPQSAMRFDTFGNLEGSVRVHEFQTSNNVGDSTSNYALWGYNSFHFAHAGRYSSTSFSLTSTQTGNGPGEFVVGVKLGTGEFGWIRLDLEVGPRFIFDDVDFPVSITVLEMAYNDDMGASAHVERENEGSGSSVPEPGAGALVGLGLLAMGAGGIRRLRQRREAQPAH